MRRFLPMAVIGTLVYLGHGVAHARKPGADAPHWATTDPQAAALLAPEAMVGPDRESASVPPPLSDTPASPVRRARLGTGTVLFGGSYAASVLVAASSSAPADPSNLYCPVAGPWSNLGTRSCDTRACNSEPADKTRLVLDGAGQGLGAAGLVTSLFVPERSTRGFYLIGDSWLHAAPTVMGGGYGVLAAGAF